ncbi:hypothetical protein C2S51_000189 [Perilla frutescens var. frutescens]|nr:hypothetical protein C2S51_000189 [Perilla frutescens var. frutescens]
MSLPLNLNLSPFLVHHRPPQPGIFSISPAMAAHCPLRCRRHLLKHPPCLLIHPHLILIHLQYLPSPLPFVSNLPALQSFSAVEHIHPYTSSTSHTLPSQPSNQYPIPPCTKTFASLFHEPPPAASGPSNLSPKKIGTQYYYEGKLALHLFDTDTLSLIGSLELVVVGKFSQEIPNAEQIAKALGNLKLTGKLSWKFLNAKHILIILSEKSDYVKLLLDASDKATWFINGFPMRVFKWTSAFSISHESPIVVVWCRLPGLPVHLFEKHALFSVASLIGTPVEIDRHITTRAREIDLTTVIPYEVVLIIGGVVMHQKVVFKNLPVYCKGCRHIGHIVDDCFTVNGVAHLDRPVSASCHPTKPPPQKKKNFKDPPPPRHVPSQPDKGKVMASSIPSSSHSHPPKKREWDPPDPGASSCFAQPAPCLASIVHKVVEDMISALDEDIMDYSSDPDSSSHEHAPPHSVHSSPPCHEKGEFLDHSCPSSFDPGPLSRSKVSGAPPLPLVNISVNFLVWNAQDTHQLLHVRLTDFALFARLIFFTFIYAACERAGRYLLWDSLRQITPSMEDSPWLVGGDLNIFLHYYERSESSTDRHKEMANYADAIVDCQLSDAGYSGSNYIWEGRYLLEHLDRVFLNESWSSNFAVTRVSYLPRIRSDHAPLLITCQFFLQIPKSSFHFQSMWFKLNQAKQHLKWWNKNVFGNIFDKLRTAEEAVAVCQVAYDSHPFSEHRAQLHRSSAKYILRAKMEEDFWCQKSAIRWVAEGERNTYFFQGSVKQKHCKARIHSIQANDIQTLPDSVDRAQLCAASSVDEIRATFFRICNDSVSDPDGFFSLFFQSCWDIVAPDVVVAVLDFSDGFPLPRSFTATTIILLPKQPHPQSWADFHPISLCNVTNKIISKILNARLAPLLHLLLMPNQSGFVQGRLISDNILLAQELIHDLPKAHPIPNVALKLDIAKAYDRNCCFFVLINGYPAGFFHSSRGLRQRDPLSPSLFVLAVDYLSRGIDKLIKSHPDMIYHTSRRGFPVSHLAYADDILIFTQAKSDALSHLMGFPTHYSAVSGQQINARKSNFIIHSKHARAWQSSIEEVMRPPKCILQQLEQLMARFFWGSNDEAQKAHWISWKQIWLPTAEGGLGICRLSDIYDAFSFKLWWRFRSQNFL